MCTGMPLLLLIIFYMNDDTCPRKELIPEANRNIRTGEVEEQHERDSTVAGKK